MSQRPDDLWQKSQPDKVHDRVFDRVRLLESEMSDTFDRFVKLAALYDPLGPQASGTDVRTEMAGVVENGIASNIDTVTADVATTDVRTRYMTDDGNWSQQRQARHLEWYVEGVGKMTDRSKKCRQAFRSSALKGKGLVGVFADKVFKRVIVEHVLVDDMIVPDRQCIGGRRPREMHRRRIMDREDLIAEFPDHEKKILDAAVENDMLWAGYRPIERNELVVLESWYLPYGTQGHKNYRPGRHTMTIRGLDLLDEEYHKTRFPFAEFSWTDRDESWYSIGGAERVMGSQRALNRRNLHIERQNDQAAFPTIFVRQADAGLGNKMTTNRAGSVAVYRADKPEVSFPPAVSGETYKSRVDLKESISNEFGHSSMVTHGAAPPGLESGVAIREWRDSTSNRFASQEKMFEDGCIDVDWLIIDACKELGADAPVIMKSTRWGTKKITWAKVDMADVRVQAVAASTLPRTPSGRSQLTLEWAQAGVITMDEFRRLSQHPDLERELSLYTAAMEAIEESIEEIAEGNVVVPEPFDNLKMAAHRSQQTYLIWRPARCPEYILENLRQYNVQALYEADQAASPQAMPMPAGAPEMAHGAPPMPGTDPMAQAALAPQAMQLVAG